MLCVVHGVSSETTSFEASSETLARPLHHHTANDCMHFRSSRVSPACTLHTACSTCKSTCQPSGRHAHTATLTRSLATASSQGSMSVAPQEEGPPQYPGQAPPGEAVCPNCKSLSCTCMQQIAHKDTPTQHLFFCFTSHFVP
jgi:hypothetical protein